MNPHTQARADKMAGNLATPKSQSIAAFFQQLQKLRVDITQITSAQFDEAIAVRGTAVDRGAASSEIIEAVAQRSELSFIIDALGPRGQNILTENGLVIIRGAEAAQKPLEKLDADISPEKLVGFDTKIDYLLRRGELYGLLSKKINQGLDGFEGIVAIIETRRLEGGGERLLPFSERKDSAGEISKEIAFDNLREKRLSEALTSYVQDWVDSGLGDPRLLELSPNQQLAACLNFPAADRLAYVLTMKERAGELKGFIQDWVDSGIADESLLELTDNQLLTACLRFPDADPEVFKSKIDELKSPEDLDIVTGASLNFSMADRFTRIRLNTIENEGGVRALSRDQDSGSSNQIPTGPMER